MSEQAPPAATAKENPDRIPLPNEKKEEKKIEKKKQNKEKKKQENKQHTHTETQTRIHTNPIKDAIKKAPWLKHSICGSLEKDKTKIFNDLYQTLYNEVPHPIAIYRFDAVGIISSLNNQNLKINNENILSEMGFSGLTGMFKFKEDGIVERKLALYHIKNENILTIKN